MNSQLAARRIVFFLGMVAAVVPGAETTVAASAVKERSRPNILLVIADDWSLATSVRTAAPGSKPRPSIGWCAAKGVLFSSAFTNNLKCSPCRASFVNRSQYLAA